MKKKTKKTRTLKHMGAPVVLAFERYMNGRLAIELLGTDGEPWAHCTVNMVDHIPAEGCVFIKDYSENEGMLKWLERNKIAKATGRRVRSGFVEVPEARILKKYIPKEGV